MPCVACHRAFPSGWCQAPETATLCGQVTCKACGKTQCHGNGSGRGTCRECHYGILEGWSDPGTGCSYKGCTQPAVYKYMSGSKKRCCSTHGARVLARKVK